VSNHQLNFLFEQSETDLHFICSLNGTIEVPFVNLTMKGGDDYYVMDPIALVLSKVGAENSFPILWYPMILHLLNLVSFCDMQNEGNFLCLAIVKSNSVNIIGREYLTEQFFLPRIYHHKILHSELSITVHFINITPTVKSIHITD